jgi:hypothetical protein
MKEAEICPRGTKLIAGNCIDRNKETAKAFLQLAINQRNSELPIQKYIEFMDLLPKQERNRILLDKDITKLIDTINRYHLG